MSRTPISRNNGIPWLCPLTTFYTHGKCGLRISRHRPIGSLICPGPHFRFAVFEVDAAEEEAAAAAVVATVAAAGYSDVDDATDACCTAGSSTGCSDALLPLPAINASTI